MENSQILYPLNDILTVKSAARLCCVSRIMVKYIKPKNYSFYKIFKQLNFSNNFIILLLFNSDQQFIELSAQEEYFYPIESHKYEIEIKSLLYKKYDTCVSAFLEDIVDLEDDFFDVFHHAVIHCATYTDNKLICGTLSEMCCDIFEINRFHTNHLAYLDTF